MSFALANLENGEEKENSSARFGVFQIQLSVSSLPATKWHSALLSSDSASGGQHLGCLLHPICSGVSSEGRDLGPPHSYCKYSISFIPHVAQKVIEDHVELAGWPATGKFLEACPLAPSAPALFSSVHAQYVLLCFQGREQDVSRIVHTLNECLAALPREQLRRVGGIGVSGQMHGVLFWKTGQGRLDSG